MQPLTARALQRFDDSQAAQLTSDDLTRPQLGIAAPARDLEAEFRRQVRADADAQKKHRLTKHGSQTKLSTGSRSPSRNPHFAGVNQRPKQTDTSASPLRSSTPRPLAGRVNQWTRAVTPTSRYWSEYSKRPVVERLTDMTRWEETVSHLHEERRNQLRDECPFEPALAIATVMGTHAGSKRVDASKGRAPSTVSSPLASGSTVRVVTIRAPTDHTSDSDFDDAPLRERRSKNVGRGESGPPHFMLPLPVPPPSPPPPTLQLTPRAAAKKRTRQDLVAWAENRDVKRLEAKERKLQSEIESDANICTSWCMSRTSAVIVDGMADRRLDVFAQAEMDAMAQAVESKRRIAIRQEEILKDIRSQRPASSESRRGESPSLKWFVNAVRNDPAWTRL